MKKIYSILLLLLLVLSGGCFNEKKESLTDEQLMAQNFKKLIADMGKTANKIKRADYSTILDGVYIDKTDKIEYYSKAKLLSLNTDGLNQIIADLYEISLAGDRALIVVSNRALPYIKMAVYTGPQDFSDDEKSFAATDSIALDTIIYDMDSLKYYTANGDETGASILNFKFQTTDTIGNIDQNAMTIELTIPKSEEVNLNSVTVEFQASQGAVVKVGELVQESGVTVNDFSSTVIYAVTSLNGDITKEYTVRVNINDLGNTHLETGDFSTVDEANWGTAQYELGANADGADRTFAVYSKNATKILLEIYETATTGDAKYDYWMQKGADNIWRAKLKNVPSGTYYAFRAWGPNWEYDGNWVRGNSSLGYISDVDEYGNRFNPNKVLYDPYTKEMSHDKMIPEMEAAGVTEAIYATGGADTSTPMTYNGIDSRNCDTGRWAPKGIVVDDSTDYGTKPKIAQKDAILYEAHVRGLTNDESSMRLTTILSGIDGFENVVDIADSERGTYAGAAKMAKYLKALGITTIELLPVHETANDMNSDAEPAGNFWGYMTFGYFAPDRRYSSDKTPGGPTREFKEMVKAFHNEGMEVYLDVVYNHTGEGGNWSHNNDITGFTSFGGFDASEYYQLTTENYIVDGATGCGNQLNFSKAVNINLVKDSIKYWTESMGVDGFRFDLAPVLGRKPDEWARDAWETGLKTFYPDHELLTDLISYAESNSIELQAEAWDMWGYQVGNFPSGWAEWNGRYRDGIRCFMKGDGNTFTFNSMVNGDYDNFNDQGGPQKSTNFIVAHDGFTLMDLVSYNAKNNDNPWPFGPSDGGNDQNDSWDSNGDQALRRARLRNFWAVQTFSRGIPMLVYGDELARTQNGNNNPYNVDSVATWNNYDMIATDSPNTVISDQHNNFGTDTNADGKNNIFLFANNLLKLRGEHPALRQADYTVAYDFKKEDGTSSLSDGDKAVWIKINGATVGDSNFLVFVNMADISINFSIPDASDNMKWVRRVDTASWAEAESNNFWTSDTEKLTGSYSVNGYSVVVLEEVVSNQVDDPVISGEYTGVYIDTQTISITCPTDGATIKYSLDGTDPSLGEIYTAPLELTADGGNGLGGYRLRAVAVKDGMDNSITVEKRFTVTSQTDKTYDFGTNVMLQGFGWESHEGIGENNWYQVISTNKDDIKNSFDWVWFPPSSVAASDEGYIPVQLNVLDSLYGTEADLKQAVADISPAKAIADIVINHRSGSTGWGDFTNPAFDEPGEYYSIAPNDEGFTDSTSDIYNISNSLRGWGWDDIGFDGSRDLDHSNIRVQEELINWMNTRLKTDIGFKGWRYDFVKGYAGEFVGYYNSKTSPEISIGELWAAPNNWESHQAWVDATYNGGAKSMIFDFALKAKLNSAFGWFKNAVEDGESVTDYSNNNLAMNLTELQWGYNSSKPENAVTFVDNHDTGSTQHSWELRADRVYLAYVYILTHPGLPCVFWEHFFNDNPIYDGGVTYKEHIEELINIRKTYEIGQLSTVVIEKGDAADEYAAKIDDTIAVKIGTGMTYDPGNNWGIIYSGNDFAIWKKDHVADLASLTLSTGALNSEFNKDTVDYSADLSYFVENIKVTPTVVDTNATIKVNGTAVESGAESGDIALAVGENTVTVEVLSADGLKTKTYTLTAIRGELSAQAVADNITAVNTPAQDATSLTMPTVPDAYEIVIKSSTDETVIGLDGAITMPDANTTVSIVFTVTNTSDSSTADTQSLDVLVSSDATAPVFAGIVTASNSLGGKITLTWNEATDNKTASENMKYNIYWASETGVQDFGTANKTVTGVLTADITDADGIEVDTDYYFVVRAEDEIGNSDSNTAEQTGKALDTDSTLNSLSLSSGTLSPEFASDTINYTVLLGNEITTETVTATVNSAVASLTVDGSSVNSGEVSQELTMNTGENSIDLVVTAEDGTARTYTILFKKADTLTIHYAIPSWGDADSAKISTYTDGSFTGSDITMTVNGNWYEKTIDLTSGTGELGFKLQFSEGAAVKYLTFDTTWTDVTYTSSTKNIWIDSRDPDAWGTLTDSNNYSLAAEKYSETELDIKAPTYTAAPATENLTETGVDLRATLDENGTVYYVVVADGADAPTLSQVKAGTDSTDTAALKSGSMSETGSGVLANISGLTALTAYDIYVLGEDTAGNIQSDLIKLDISTPDTTAPTFTAGPALTNNSSEGFDLTASLDENGTVYYVVLADGVSVPTAAQVKAGTDSTDTAALKSGSMSETGSGVSVSILGLNASTAYDIYVVAEDDEATANMQATVSKMDITTTSGVDAEAPTFGGLTAATDSLSAKIRLTWTKASDNETLDSNIKYNIYWATETGTQDFGTVNKTVTGVETVDITEADGISLSTDYYFVVRAEDETANEDTNTAEQAGRALSSDSSLSSLALSSGTLSPDFASDTTSYTVLLGSSVGTETITATANSADGSLTVDGSSVNSGEASQELTMNTGENSIDVVVTAEDGTATTYTVLLKKADTITVHYLIPSWGDADSAKINSYTDGSFTGSDIIMTANGSWYEASVDVLDASAELGFKLQFNQSTAGKYLTLDTTWTDITYTSGTKNIWIDSRNPDSWSGNNYSLAVEKYSDTAFDIVAPTYTVVPATENLTETGVDLTATLDENGTVYYVVVADGADAPTVSQVKAGTDSTDGAALKSGSALETGSGVRISVSGLIAATAYDIYMVAEDDETVVNLQDTVTKLDITTPDTTAPVFTSAPAVSNISANGFDLTAALNENGTVYYVVVADGADAPTLSQVKAGTDSTDTAALKSGSSTDAGSGVAVTVSGLTGATAYDIYVLGEDTTGNEQDSVTKLDVTTSATADTTAPIFTGDPVVSNLTSTAFDINGTQDETGTVYYVVVADGATAPSSSEVKEGIDYSDATVLKSGTVNAVTATEFTMNVTGLTSATAYDLYVVAEDDEASPNLQASSSKVDLETYPSITIDGTKDSDYTVFAVGADTAADVDLMEMDVTNDGSNIYIAFDTSNPVSSWSRNIAILYQINDTPSNGTPSVESPFGSSDSWDSEWKETGIIYLKIVDGGTFVNKVNAVGDGFENIIAWNTENWIEGTNFIEFSLDLSSLGLSKGDSIKFYPYTATDWSDNAEMALTQPDNFVPATATAKDHSTVKYTDNYIVK